MRWKSAVALATAMAVGIPACGGQSTTARKADFASRAKAICQRTDTSVNVLRRRILEHREQLGTAQGRVLAAFRTEEAALAALDPPAEIADAYHRYMTTLGKMHRLSEVRLKSSAALEGWRSEAARQRLHLLDAREAPLSKAAASLAQQLHIQGCL